MIHAVVFDLDDTLFPEQQFVESGFHAVSDWMMSRFGTPDLFDRVWQMYLGGIRGNIFNLALRELNMKDDQTLVAEMIKVYREHRPVLELFEDSRWALEFFKKTKKLGIITDGYLVTQQNKVNALNLTPWFDVVIFSDEYGQENWKPSPVPYRKCMDALGMAGNDCVYVADNPAKDFIAAKDLGWRTVRIVREKGEYGSTFAEAGQDADTRIYSLYALANLIR